MINHKNNYYFIKPLGLSAKDMEFNVYNSEGRFIGTNITGIEKTLFDTEDDRLEFEEFIDTECQKSEFKIKFLKEYKDVIENAKLLNLDLGQVVLTMDKKWGFPKHVTKGILNLYV
ncbi:MAG: hypothetical protein K0R54_34 [Clostridiaceae bacterium]|jgi:hypothetical protein|nr:hypothetical protein [Clostridiaceae bacterium]